MKLELAMNFLIFVCSLAGTVYSLFNFFGKKKALYLKISACGVLAIMFSRLYQVVYLATLGSLNRGFHIGMLGIMASFMFFFCANFGQIDGLVDDKTSAFRKTRIISFLSPLVIFIIYLFFILNVESAEAKIAWGAVAFFIMQCAYYSFKHVIIHDVDLGFVKCIKKYNVTVLVYAVMSMLEPIGLYLDIKPLYAACCCVTALAALIMLPVLKRGVDKWTI